MFLLEHSLSQPLRRVSREDRDPRLSERCSVIVGFIHQVHGRTALPRAAVEHRLMHSPAIHPLTSEIRQQRGMDVDDAAPLPGAHRRGNQLEVARQHQQLYPVSAEQHEPRFSVG